MATEADISYLLESIKRIEATLSGTAIQLPRITHFKVADRIQVLGGEVLTLTWITEGLNIDKIATFHIYSKNLLLKNSTPLHVASVTDGPAQVKISTNQDSIVIFQIQIEMKTGARTILNDSPTVTANVAQGVIREDDLAFSLLRGPYQLQPVTSITVDTDTLSTTTVIDVFEEGALLYLRFQTAVNNPGGSPSVNLKIGFDGQTPVAYDVFSGSSSFTQAIQTLAVQQVGAGPIAGDYINSYIGFGYLT